jgi:hypothetical protein
MKILKFVFFSFLVIVSIASCKKEYSLENGNLIQSAGTWSFQEGGSQYTGNVDSSFIEDAGGTKILTIEGKSSGGGENFSIALFSTGSFQVGTYLASLSEVEFDYSTTAKTIYEGDFLTGEFTVTITSLSNNIISGTFSGSVEDSTGNTKQITLGTFTSSIDLGNNGGGTGGAEGTLGVSAGACTPVNITGTYTQGIALSSNTVEVEVNITTPGTFTIATNTVNGVYFIKSGTFTSRGVQSVILDGAGTPVNSGTQNFTVTFGASNCTFPINFLPGTPPPDDYFPTTVNSNWTYGLQSGTVDDSALITAVPYAPTIAGNVYSTFTADDLAPSGFPDSFYYRKSAGSYYEYIDLNNYFTLDQPAKGEYVFLKDNVGPGTSFDSPNFTVISSGISATLYIKTTITEKAVSATIGGVTFPDVIKVQYGYFIAEQSTTTPQFTEEKWFAKNVGLVYYNSFFLGDVLQVGKYTVF